MEALQRADTFTLHGGQVIRAEAMNLHSGDHEVPSRIALVYALLQGRPPRFSPGRGMPTNFPVRGFREQQLMAKLAIGDAWQRTSSARESHWRTRDGLHHART